MISVEQLKKKYIFQISSADDSVTLQRWTAYKCLFSELDYNGSHYCLNNGTWYKINNYYTKMIDEDYKSTKTSDIQFWVHSDDFLLFLAAVNSLPETTLSQLVICLSSILLDL